MLRLSVPHISLAEGQVQAVLVQATKANDCLEVWLCSFSSLDTSGSKCTMPWLLYSQENRSQYPLNRMPDGPQNKSGCFGEEQNKLCKLSLYILHIPRTIFEKYYSIHSIFEKTGYVQKEYYWHKILPQLIFQL